MLVLMLVTREYGGVSPSKAGHLWRFQSDVSCEYFTYRSLSSPRRV